MQNVQVKLIYKLQHFDMNLTSVTRGRHLNKEKNTYFLNNCNYSYMLVPLGGIGFNIITLVLCHHKILAFFCGKHKKQLLTDLTLQTSIVSWCFFLTGKICIVWYGYITYFPWRMVDPMIPFRFIIMSRGFPTYFLWINKQSLLYSGFFFSIK